MGCYVFYILYTKGLTLTFASPSPRCSIGIGAHWHSMPDRYSLFLNVIISNVTLIDRSVIGFLIKNIAVEFIYGTCVLQIISS